MKNDNGGTIDQATRAAAHEALYEVSAAMVQALTAIATPAGASAIEQIEAALACFQTGLIDLPECIEQRTIVALYGRLREIHAALECAHTFRFPIWLLAAIRGELDAAQGYLAAFQRAA